MVKNLSIKNDFNVPWYSNLHDWILIIIKLIAFIFIIWNISYYSFMIIYDDDNNAFNDVVISNDSISSNDANINDGINDINDIDEPISIINSQIDKSLESSSFLFPTISSQPNIDDPISITKSKDVESIITSKSQEIKPTKTSSTTETFYDIDEPISIVKSPNVNPTKLPSNPKVNPTKLPSNPSNPSNQPNQPNPSNQPNQSNQSNQSNPPPSPPSPPSTPSIPYKDVEINQEYCQSDKCRFLFAYYPPEQETQANQHFLSFLQLAERLNRIMVLTNVGNSHIFACRPFPFDFYYNVKKLEQRFPNVKFITQKEFQDWTKERIEKPDTFHGFIAPDSPNYMIKNVKPYVKQLNQRSCLRFFDLKLNDTTIFKVLNAGPDEAKFEKIMLREFNNTNAEVLLIKHEIRHQLFNKLDSLDYAEHIINAADNISKNLRPYIASHWRMEHGIQRLMPKCADNLINWLKDKQFKTGIKNLYLATDYPLIGGIKKSQSTTWRDISEFNTIAIQKLNSSVNLNTWVSINSFDYLPKDDKLIKNELMGAGIQGILDKLVLVQADYFVSCPKFCGRYQSKFTKKVRDARKKEIKKKSSHLKNVWDVWYRVD